MKRGKDIHWAILCFMQWQEKWLRRGRLSRQPLWLWRVSWMLALMLFWGSAIKLMPARLEAEVYLLDKNLQVEGFGLQYHDAMSRLTFTREGISGSLRSQVPFFTINGHFYALERAPFNARFGIALKQTDGERFQDIIRFYKRRVSLAEKKRARNTTVSSAQQIFPKEEDANRGNKQNRESNNSKSSSHKNKITKQTSVQPLLVPIVSKRLSLPAPARVSREQARIHTIILDPGHGGKDPGAMAFGYQEKNLILSFAKEVAGLLKERFPTIKVILTRKDDSYLTIVERANIANRSLKRDENGVFVSLHLNAWFHGRARGYEVYTLENDQELFTVKANRHMEHKAFFFPYQQEDVRQAFAFLYTLQYARESRLLAEFLLRSVQKDLPVYSHASKVRTDTFYVLKGTLMPSVLIELGYITNEQDISFILNKEKRFLLLEVIVTGLGQYIDLFEKEKGFTESIFDLETY